MAAELNSAGLGKEKRSEERRVGKEGRARGSAEKQKKERRRGDERRKRVN